MNANANPYLQQQDTVLVVDDSPETLVMINDTLEKSGMTSLVSMDPIQGLNIARKMQPDLILLDGLMPRMSGFDFCTQCKAIPELQDIPIVFMTGLSDSESIVKAFDAGGVDYVTKPIDSAALIARIRVHLANSKIIRSTQLALDKAGQHVFAMNQQGALLWKTPDVQETLERIQHKANKTIGEENWLTSSFWPAVAHWIKNDLTGTATELNLHLGSTTISLEILNPNAASPEILVKLHTGDQTDDSDQLQTHFGLSGREAEVLLWIAKGKTNREMGHILGISPRTINKHLEQVFKKLEVDNRTNAAAKAIPILRPH